MSERLTDNNNNIKVIYNNTAQDIPHWGSTNFDSIYILQYNAKNNTISFSIEQENLNIGIGNDVDYKITDFFRTDKTIIIKKNKECQML